VSLTEQETGSRTREWIDAMKAALAARVHLDACEARLREIEDEVRAGDAR
jgi:hypothetical protein